MKRIIKFRQYLGKGKWHYLEFKHGHCEGVAEASLDKFPISQFTGLLDKNGKEIYEGDIMDRFPIYQGRVIVKWNKRICAFGGCFGEEVIGNIYENPELLEGER